MSNSLVALWMVLAPVHLLGARKPKPLPKIDVKPLYRVDALDVPRQIEAGEPFRLRFRVSDIRTREPQADIERIEMSVAVADAASGRVTAVPAGGGIYEAFIPVPQPGEYYVQFPSATDKGRLEKVPHLVLRVVAPSRAAEAGQLP